MDTTLYGARVSLWAALAVAVLIAVSGCGHAPVTEMSVSVDESADCLTPNADELAALDGAIAAWAQRDVRISFDLSIGHPVSVCFVALVPYDAPEGWRAVGRVFRDDDGSRMFIEAGRGLVQTTETVTHEIGHVVTWSSEHAEGRGLLGVMAEGPGWSASDLEHLASFGL